MSEEQSKRSRKSKLVVRDCESDDVVTREMQHDSEPSKKKKSSEDPEQQTMTPIEFSVKVEVEEFDEDFDFESADNGLETKDTVNSEKELTSETIGSEYEEEKSNSGPSTSKTEERKSDHDYTNSKGDTIKSRADSLMRKLKVYDKLNRTSRTLKQCKVSIDEILEAMDEIAKTSTCSADRIINVGARNFWGIIRIEPHTFTRVEKLLEHAINEWKKWNMESEHRNIPLMYKCYTCSRAWWHFDAFRTHLANHEDTETDPLMIDTETNYHECNLIAYNGVKPVIFDIPIESNCWLCNQPFEYHMISKRRSGVFYLCKYCPQRYYTCAATQKHEGVCVERRKKLKDELPPGSVVDIFKCSLCEVIFFSKTELQVHFVSCHSVRSDIPVLNAVKMCSLCFQNMTMSLYHRCPRKNVQTFCNNCKVRFINKQLQFFHRMYNKTDYKCEICNLVLPYKCMEVDHALGHTKNFVLLYKCTYCVENIMFLNESSIRQHMFIWHKKKFDKRRGTELVIVPNKCVESDKVEELDIMACLSGKFDIVATSNELKVSNIKTTKSKNLKTITVPLPLDDDEEKSKENVPTTENTIESTGTMELENVQTVTTMENIADLNDSITIKEEPLETVEEEGSFSYEALLSSMFSASENAEKVKNAEVTIKQEVEEELFEDDIIVLNKANVQSSLNVQIKQEYDNEDTPNVPSTSNVRWQRYKCATCPYVGTIGSFKLHVIRCRAGTNCNMCRMNFVTFKMYLEHLSDHGVEKLRCPQCTKLCDNHTALISHVKSHVWGLFKWKKIMDESLNVPVGMEFTCKDCRKVVTTETLCTHWDRHLRKKPLIITHPQAADDQPPEITARSPESQDSGQQNEVPDLTATVEEAPGDLLANVTVTLSEDIPEPESVDPLELDQLSHKDSSADWRLSDENVQKLIDIIQTHSPKHSKKLKRRHCVLCKHRFDRKNDFKRHLIEHLLNDALSRHQAGGALQCQICLEVLGNPGPYREHLRAHASLPVYRCPACWKQFSDSSNYAKHKKVHRNAKVLQCTICSKKFHTSVTLSRHMEEHEKNEPINCKCCTKIFYTNSAYKKHLRNRKNMLFSCKYCKEKFRFLKDRWDHEWEVHNIRKYQADCPACGLSFRKFQDVKRHYKEEHSTDLNTLNILLKNTDMIDWKNGAAGMLRIKEEIEEVEIEVDEDDDE